MITCVDTATNHINKSLVRLALIGSVFLLAITPAQGAIGLDVVTSTDQSGSNTSITSQPFSTAMGNELLLAFISSDANSAGVTVTGITGGSLNWVLVRRANAQLGTAEIWRAFASVKLTNTTVRASLSQSVAASLTVVALTGIDTSGTNGSGAIGAANAMSASSGAPSASLVATRSGSLVFGVGNDFDNAISRAVGPSQTMVHQYLATVNDTYWVQRQSSPTGSSGVTVTINDTAPSGDRYNLAIAEVLAAPVSGPTFTMSGTVTPIANGAGSTLTLSQGGMGVRHFCGSSSGDL